MEGGQRTSALRFGDPRVMALFQAITGFTHLPRGFRNRDLCPRVEALLGRPYRTAQMTYDLRRLRLKGLIHRIEDTPLHRHHVWSEGRVLLSKALSSRLAAQWPACCRLTIRCPVRFETRSTTSTCTSAKSTRRPLLPPKTCFTR